MCKVLKVSRSGYYDWKDRPLSRREKYDKYLVKEIRRIHIDSRSNYGTIKVWKVLKQEGIECGKHRVAKIRKKYNIESKRRKRFKITTLSKNTEWIAPNRLNRCFKTEKPNQVWVGDVTYIGTQSGWLYLAILIDLYSRKVIGWSMSDRNNTQLVLSALKMALENRTPRLNVLHHSDRGSVYGSNEYRHKLINSGLVPSMSRKADCYDNAVAESFFSTLKNELIYARRFKSHDEAKSEVFKFIEIFYNRQRLHQTLGYITPEMMEQNLSFN
jgi:putative transposase